MSPCVVWVTKTEKGGLLFFYGFAVKCETQKPEKNIEKKKLYILL